MAIVFKKELMLKRLEEQNLLKFVNSNIERIMDNLDGQPVVENSLGRGVDEDNVYYCIENNSYENK